MTIRQGMPSSNEGVPSHSQKYLYRGSARGLAPRQPLEVKASARVLTGVASGDGCPLWVEPVKGKKVGTLGTTSGDSSLRIRNANSVRQGIGKTGSG